MIAPSTSPWRRERCRGSGERLQTGVGSPVPDGNGRSPGPPVRGQPKPSRGNYEPFRWAGHTPRHGSIATRCRANRSSVATRTPTKRPRPARTDAAHPTQTRPRPAQFGRAPRQGHAQPDLRHVGEAVGLGVCPDLHQADHGHQRPQIPKPADKHIGEPPQPYQRRYRNDRQQQGGADDLRDGQTASRMGIEDRQSRGPKRTAPRRPRKKPGHWRRGMRAENHEGTQRLHLR